MSSAINSKDASPTIKHFLPVGALDFPYLDTQTFGEGMITDMKMLTDTILGKHKGHTDPALMPLILNDAVRYYYTKGMEKPTNEQNEQIFSKTHELLNVGEPHFQVRRADIIDGIQELNRLSQSPSAHDAETLESIRILGRNYLSAYKANPPR